MEDRLTMSRYFEDANVEFMTGAYTQCWQSWRYDNVTPAYNKLTCADIIDIILLKYLLFCAFYQFFDLNKKLELYYRTL